MLRVARNVQHFRSQSSNDLIISRIKYRASIVEARGKIRSLRYHDHRYDQIVQLLYTIYRRITYSEKTTPGLTNRATIKNRKIENRCARKLKVVR